MLAKFLFLLSVTVLVNFSLGDPVVQLPNGAISGRESKTVTGKLFYSFQKIPYAKPPIYNLRFKPPVPPNNWDGILDTSKDLDVSCHQTYADAVEESEDCLYLNVYTSLLPDGKVGGLPVMFYIYGGAFTAGDSRFLYYGPEYLIDDGVIVVTINYRLGPFGFLSTGDEVVPGNNGLKDQLLALKWTSDNIKLFGGDPAKITIFGESAGSMSVAYQLLNTKSEGLFAGAILESGSFLMPSSFQRRPREIAFATAAILNDTFNNIDDSNVLLSYLQSVPAQELDHAALKYSQGATIANRFDGRFWAPVIEPEHEGALVTQKMYQQLKSGNFIKVPCLIGLNSEEDLYEWADENALRNILQAFDEDLKWLAPKDMMIEDENNRIEMGTKIREMYTGGALLAENLGLGIRLFSDNSFARSIIKQAELQSNVSDVYFYQFSYDGDLGGINFHYDGAERVGHTEEIFYIWKNPVSADLGKFPETDQITQRRIQKIWSDFAKFQNPTPEPSDLLQNITWPKVSPDNFLYVDINENLEIKKNPKAETYGKWIELYDSLGFENFDTY